MVREIASTGWKKCKIIKIGGKLTEKRFNETDVIRRSQGFRPEES